MFQSFKSVRAMRCLLLCLLLAKGSGSECEAKPGAVPDAASLVQVPRQGASTQEARKSCLSFIHIPKSMGGSVEGSMMKAQGYEGYWDYPGCAQAARAQLSQEKRFWGICDDRLKCSEPRFWPRPKEENAKNPWPKCMLPSSLPASVPESIRNLGMRAGCSPWHLPPAFDPSLVRYFREECDSFCIVRDPLERMISQLKFVYKLEQVCEPQKLEDLTRMFVDKLDLKQDCHAVPQVYYVFQDGNPKAAPICRHVLKFHEVNQSFPALMESYSLGEVKLLSAIHEKERCTLTPTPATLRMVQEFYAQDYEAFGFQLPKSTISL
ncbi:hypothetical protein AK812_SmicGene34061 [Symbiodinium microadriaticum]|uniref:Uncharacterized protein n=1 Tax=Symbiodinium microadriaticum TaxID=2951 RepID=A0A1Q9CQ04_SYMMI|nr:hypothetical protein AK812_SmicGene34061 [Symbiodinium microadriaticum]CAE7599925.1 unnamed protein product [Symbiodinium microadriaticum]